MSTRFNINKIKEISDLLLFFFYYRDIEIYNHYKDSIVLDFGHFLSKRPF